MGKGDKKTKRGKIIKGSYGVRRPKKKKNVIPEAPAKAKKKKAAPKAVKEEKKVTKPAAKVKKAEEKKVEAVETKV
ncbi:MAG: 30S ribosomal protein THX, partial [Bacteroidales bacterium]|nr:30S ribosomal protein THX [Bacteroidales bacterium]